LDALNQVQHTLTGYQLTPIIATMISRRSSDPAKNLLNALIIQNWRATTSAAINDIAEMPALGADGANAGTGCFFGDYTHLTGPGTGTCYNGLSGYSVVAKTVTDTINYIDGGTLANPQVVRNAEAGRFHR
jgi:hypothetical protein